MPQKRDKHPNDSSPISTSSEQSGRMATSYLPPLSTYGQPAQFEQRVTSGNPELSRAEGPQRSGQYAYQTARRQPGAAPLSDILLQDPAATGASGPASQRDFSQTSPTFAQHPDLGPLRLHNDPQSPERSRQEYFDPARHTSESQAGYGGSLSRATGGFAPQAGPGRYGQSSSEGYGNPPSIPSSSSGVPTRISPQDRNRLELIIKQQPQAARACGHGERDRRVIDPPPILQLRLKDYDPDSPSDREILRSPYNMVHCTLLSVPHRNAPLSVSEDVSRIHDPNDPSRDLRRLMGSLTMSPFIGYDIFAKDHVPKSARIGAFYIFSDLSCRQNGLYRLRFTMLPVEVTALETGGRTETATVVTSEVFEVFSAKDFPGMTASSDLTKELKRQGAPVPVKKGNEGKGGRKPKKRGSDSDGSESDGSEEPPASKAAGKKPRS